MGMDELLVFGVEGTAEWRERMAVEYPHDSSRNTHAANMLRKLAEGLRALEGSALHQRLDDLLTGGNLDLPFSEIISQASRNVGFRWFPENAAEFLGELINDLEREVQTHSFSSDAHAVSDRTYMTPRFPNGIRRAVLSLQPLEIQRHVILYWFILHFEPAQGTFFGFAKGRGPAAFDGSVYFGGSTPFGLPQNPDIRVAGFDQAPFFDGGTAGRFLRAEFVGATSEEVLSEIALALPGLWMRRPPLLPAPGASAQVRRATLGALLDAFDDGMRELSAMPPGRWDNNPPESERLLDESAALAPDAHNDILRITADMRLAVASEEYSRAAALWDEVRPVLVEVARYLVKKLDSALDAAVKVVGAAVGASLLITLLVAVGVLVKADAITALLKILHLN